MANRDLSNFRTVTQQVTENPDQTVSMAIDVGKQLFQQNQEARITEGMSSVQLELNALQNQYQIDFEGDPTGGLDKYKQERKKIFNKYGESISPVYKRQWEDNMRNMAQKNDLTQQGWTLRQTRVNTINSVNESMKNNFTQATFDGQNFGNNEDAEVEAFVNFGTSRKQLEDFATDNLGETTTAQMFSDYDADYSKSFMSGLIETNAAKALEVLNSGVLDDNLAAKDIKTLKDAAKNRIVNVTKRRDEQAILDIMTGEDGLYKASQKRDLSQAELQGAYAKYNTPAAVQKVLNSANGYGKEGDAPKLTTAQKVDNKIKFYRKLATFEAKDEITAEDINEVRLDAYSLIDNKSITKLQGEKAITNLFEPAIKSVEEDLKTYQRGVRNPFQENIGFSGVQKYFKKEIEIDADDSALTKAERGFTNNSNELRLYENYEAALEKAMPDGVPIGSINTLDKSKRIEIYKKAQKEAISNFAFDEVGYVSKDTDTEQDITNVIQNEMEDKRRRASQDIIDKAYETPAIQSFGSVEELNAAGLEVGTPVIVNGVRGKVTR